MRWWRGGGSEAVVGRPNIPDDGHVNLREARAIFLLVSIRSAQAWIGNE